MNQEGNHPKEMEARALLKIVNKTCCRGEWPSTCPSHSATSSNLLIASISLDFYPYTGNNSFIGLDWLTRKTFLRILVKFGNWISQNLNQMLSLWANGEHFWSYELIYNEINSSRYSPIYNFWTPLCLIKSIYTYSSMLFHNSAFRSWWS
jgi:hypothetical protein